MINNSYAVCKVYLVIAEDEVRILTYELFRIFNINLYESWPGKSLNWRDLHNYCFNFEDVRFW